MVDGILHVQNKFDLELLRLFLTTEKVLLGRHPGKDDVCILKTIFTVSHLNIQKIISELTWKTF